MRSKSTEVSVSDAGGRRTPKISGTDGRGNEFVCDASESVYYENGLVCNDNNL